MTWLATTIVIIAGGFGLIIGSFLNVVVWRVPRGESIVHPPSACPHCAVPIRPYDNIPVLSWLMLGGKCRSCRGPISARYPLVELATGLAFSGIVLAGFLGAYSLALVPALLYFCTISITLTLIDIDTHRLPNAIVLPSHIVVGALLALASLLTGDWWALVWALVGGAILFTAYFVMLMIYPQGMGFGDVKLSGVIGLILGWIGLGSLAVGGFAAFLLGGLFGVILLLTRRADRKSGIPFGPWMLAGAWVGIFAGEILSQEYLKLIGLA
jgi:leader peptidase (prepilin peptidase)/N-methyltransferase